MNPRVALIGCGLIGHKRAKLLPHGSVIVVCDTVMARAQSIAQTIPGCRSTTSYMDVVESPDVDIVIIATINAHLAPIATAAARNGKHVLVEKPGAVNMRELEELESTARQRGVLVRFGYNHRYHPAALKSVELHRSGALGDIMFLRGRYGHGGRVGYDREWRADPSLAGGGELLDQGVHLIDLAGIFLGKFSIIDGHTATYYWDMPVDDNAFLSLRSATGQTAWLHASCSEWKNLFSLEIYGRNGKLHWEGLGGSYGVERLTFYRMLPEMGPPETTIWEFPRGDDSWRIEMEEFLDDIRLSREPIPGFEQARSVIEVVESIYRKPL